MKPRSDLDDIENALKAFDFVEGEDYIFRKGSACATINGRVVTFNVSGMPDEIYGSLYDEDFEPQNVMETFQAKQGIRPLADAIIDVQSQAMEFEEALKEYSGKVYAYFIARGVPVACSIIRVCHQPVCDFFMDREATRGRERVHLFSVSVRFDLGMEFMFEGGSAIVVFGEDINEDMEAVFNEELLTLTPEDPVDRVDYSSSYHYRYIVNAIPDMLRVGVVNVCKSVCNIVSTLDKPITSCRKHFRPEVLGTLTDFDVKFKSSIHPVKKWNE